MSRLKNLILNYSNLRIVKRGVFTIVLTLIITLPLLVTGCGRFDSNDNGTPLDSSTEENRTTASRVAVATAGAKTLLLTVPTRGEILQSQSVPANAHGVTAVDDKIFVGDRRGTGLYSLFVSEEEREQKKPSFISLGGPAHHLASSEEFVFVTVTMKNYVAVVNAKTEKLKAKISVPKPYYAIVVPQRNRLYVTSKSTDSIRGIDLDTHKVTETIAVGKAPSHLMFDGERLWVTNAGSGDVSVVNPSTGQELKRIPTGGIPTGLPLTRKLSL